MTPRTLAITLGLGTIALLGSAVAYADEPVVPATASASASVSAPPPLPSASVEPPPALPSAVPVGLEPPPQPRVLSPLEAQWFRPPAAVPVEGATLLSDPVAVAAVANLVLGGLMLGIGVPAWAAATSSQERCGAIAGCFDSFEIDAGALAAGSALTGLGLGFAATGGITLAVVAANPKTTGDERSKPTVATVGLMFTGLSFGALIGGFTVGGANDAVGVYDPFTDGVPLFITSGLSALVGVPMLAAGAGFSTADERMRKRLQRSGRAPILDPVPASVVVGPGRATVAWVF